MKGLESQTLGKYEIIREIGHGSMATVYLARDPFSLREVALKVSNEVTTKDERQARRRRKLFFNEARATAVLRHPNIVATIDAGVEEGVRYLVLEYVPGAETLDAFCHPDRLLPVERVVAILLRCALALDYAHSQGVIHRDIKPKNILLTQDGDVKLVDFGIALHTGDGVQDTQVMGRLGSPRYMAPEQVRDEAVTTQSDIFALGVVAYELLAGVNPFAADSLPEIARRILREPQRPLHEGRTDLPAQIERIVDRCMKKHPAGRYRTAVDLAGDLSLVYDELVHTRIEQVEGTRLETLRRLDFFRGFHDSDILEVLQSASWQQHAADEVLPEGRPDQAFRLLVAGELLLRCGRVEVDILRPGACFGEVRNLLGRDGAGTLTARDPGTVITLEASVLEHGAAACRLRVQRALLRALSARLDRLLTRITRSNASSPST